MRIIIIFFYIIALAAGMAVFFKRKIEETVALSIFATIMLLYFCGLFFGTFTIGVWLCVALSILLGTYAVVTAVRKKEIGVKYCITPGIAVLLVLFIYIWWLNKGRMFSIWDEFSHWGLVVKNMYIFDYFGNHPNSTVTFRGYPPATALWQYFVSKLCGEFKEEYSYQAMGWLMGSLLLPLLQKFNWKKIVSAGISILVLALVPLVFNYLYPVSLLVDTILGLMLGYLLTSSYYDERRDSFSILNVSLSIMVLCLTKASGAFLALIYVVIALTYDIANTYKKGKGKNIYISWGFSIAALLIGKYSWSIYLRTSDTGQPWNTSSVNLINIIGLLRGRGEEYQYTVIKNFCKEMLNRNFIFNEVKLNYFFWVITIGVMFFLLYRTVEIHKRKKLATYAIIMYLGMFVYTLGLLLLYIFTYSEYEAVHVASFQRYLSTWIVGIFVFGGGVLFGRLADCACWKRVICIGGIGCLMIPILPKDAIYEYTIYRNQNIMATIEYRKQYEGIEKYIPILDYSVDCVHIVAQNSEGGEWLNCSFAITPVRTIGAWSLGELYYEEDFYTRNYTLEEYLQVLNENKCTYVYLAKIDEQFVNGYEGAFEDKGDIEQGCMYKIERMGDRTYLTKVKI